EHLGQGGGRRDPGRGRDDLRHERGGAQEPAEDRPRSASERAPPLRDRGLGRPGGVVLPQGGDPARTPAARQGPLRAGRPPRRGGPGRGAAGARRGCDGRDARDPGTL
ncbi:MAG: hypothetical protein AVDCRST_MAG05-615, partial [uncultured Rubrobacteraceae bacterium]